MEQQLQHAVAVLKGGGVVAYPTDTVYGLGADIFNEEAVGRIYQIKQRLIYQPLPILLADKFEMAMMAAAMPEIAWLLAEHFLPGGLTLIVRKSSLVPPWVTAGGDTVAVRIPNHPIALALIRDLGKPLIGTSANLSGLPSPVSTREVRHQLGDKVDFILDGGRCPGGIESTVVDVTGEAPMILREGSVSREEIERILQGSVVRGQGSGRIAGH